MSTKLLAFLAVAMLGLSACNDGATTNDPNATPRPVEPAAPAPTDG